MRFPMIAGLLLLGGCWYGEMRTEMSPGQLAQVDDARFCRAFSYYAHSLYAKSSRAFVDEYNRRVARGADCGLIAEAVNADRRAAAQDALLGVGVGIIAAQHYPRPAAPLPLAIPLNHQRQP